MSKRYGEGEGKVREGRERGQGEREAILTFYLPSRSTSPQLPLLPGPNEGSSTTESGGCTTPGSASIVTDLFGVSVSSPLVKTPVTG